MKRKNSSLAKGLAFLVAFNSTSSSALTLPPMEPVASPSASKVVVGAIAEQESLTVEQRFNDFQQAMAFASANVQHQPMVTVVSLEDFLTRSTDLSVQQTYQLTFMLTMANKQLGQIDKAIVQLTSLPETDAEPEVLINKHLQLAELYQLSSEHFQGLLHLEQAETLASTLNLNHLQVQAVVKQAKLFQTMGLHNKADSIFASLAEATKVMHPNLQVWGLIEWYEFQLGQANTESASGLLRKIKQLAKLHGLIGQLDWVEIEQAHIMALDGDVAGSQQSLASLFQKAKRNRNKQNQCVILLRLVSNHISVGELQQATKLLPAVKTLLPSVYDLKLQATSKASFYRHNANLAIEQRQWQQADRWLNEMQDGIEKQFLTLQRHLFSEQTEYAFSQLIVLQRMLQKQHKQQFAHANKFVSELNQREIRILEQRTVDLVEAISTQKQVIQGLESKSRSLALLLLAVMTFSVLGFYFLTHRRQIRLKAQNYRDPLTGLANHSALFELYKAQQVKDEGFSVVTFDLDDFRVVNDKFGHAIGNQLLQACVAKLSPLLREDCTFARFNGETFVVFCRRFDQQQAYILAERLRLELHNNVTEIQSESYQLTASFGVAQFHDQISLDALIEEATQALYQAKEHGKNRTVIAQ